MDLRPKLQQLVEIRKRHIAMRQATLQKRREALDARRAMLQKDKETVLGLVRQRVPDASSQESSKERGEVQLEQAIERGEALAKRARTVPLQVDLHQTNPVQQKSGEEKPGPALFRTIPRLVSKDVSASMVRLIAAGQPVYFCPKQGGPVEHADGRVSSEQVASALACRSASKWLLSTYDRIRRHRDSGAFTEEQWQKFGARLRPKGAAVRRRAKKSMQSVAGTASKDPSKSRHSEKSGKEVT